jgi:hypothetical protein
MRRGVVIAIVIGVVVVGVAGLGITFLLAALGKHQPLAADQMDLVGKWVDVTGDTLIIKADGEGDYTSPSTSVSGGDAHIDGDHLVIGFSMIKKQFTITKRPTAASPTLVLDGVAFTRSGGGAAEPAGVAGLTPEQGAQANAAMVTALYKAVEADDANIFSAQFAAAAHGKLTGPVLRDHFSGFFQKPMLPLLKQALDGWPKTATVAALTGDDDGNYSAKNVVTLPNGQVLTILCKYVNENGTYKAYGIDVDLPRLAQAAPPAAGAVAGLTPEQGAQANAAMLAALYKAAAADDANILLAQFAVAAQHQLTAPQLREHFAGYFQKPMLPVLKQALDGMPKTATVAALTGSGDDGNYSAKTVVAMPSGQTFTIFCKYVNENGSYKAYSIDANLSRPAQAAPAEPKAAAPADADEAPVTVKKGKVSDADDDDAPAKVKRADPLGSAGDRLAH